jgi:predicted ATPase/DNA-binding CsgD family transcriptional regulator
MSSGVRSKSLDAKAQGNLPAYLTRFVGRSSELEELVGRLEQGHRLITICGAGGLGKTRLAIELMRRSAQRFPDDAVWVALSAATDPATMGRTISVAALRHPSTGSDPIGSVVAGIGRRRMVIVLDNCEQIVGPCGDAVTRMLAACSSLVVVVTSRVALHVPDEVVYAIPPLRVWSDEGGPSDAMALFIDRASIGAPGWSDSAVTDSVVAEICERLEGLPLAIELAASWIRVLSPRDLLTEITSGVEMLTAVGEVVADRHRSMQAVLHSTWNWLGAKERDVLGKLSVFVGDFSRDAAEVVAGATLGALATLSERSLIRRVPDPSGITRYHVHELIRAFAEDQLRAQHRWRGVEHQHYLYFKSIVHSAQTAWDTPEESQALARIRVDQDNIEVALNRAVDRGAATEALQLVGGLFAYWIYSAPLEDRRRLLDQALALPQKDTEDPTIRARALNVAGYAWISIDRQRALELFTEAVSLYRRADDRVGEAWSLRGLGYAHLIWNEIEAADLLNEQSLRICREAGDRVGLAWCLYDRAESAFARRDLEAAEPLLAESLAAFSDLGIDFAAYRTLILLADVRRLRREWLRAISHYRQALEVQHARGFTARGAEILEGLGGLAAELARADLAARLLGEAAAWRRAVGVVRYRYNQADYEQSYASAHRQLSSADWMHQFKRGERLTLEEAEVDAQEIIVDLTDWCHSSPDAHLTKREIEVLHLLAEGLSNPEIATRLVLSRRTVDAHLRSIFDKLGVSTRTAAALKAHELAIGPPKS